MRGGSTRGDPRNEGPAPYRAAARLLRACLLGLCLPAAAEPTAAAGQPTAAFVQVGRAPDTQQLSAGLNWDWDRQWTFAGGRVNGYWELVASGWSYPSDDGRRRGLAQVGVVPVLRYRPGEGASPWFYELGIGATMTTTLYKSERKRFSTNFNFADHLAVGRSFGPQNRHEWALRLEHFSNAGLKQPNPGENFIELRYTRRLR